MNLRKPNIATIETTQTNPAAIVPICPWPLARNMPPVFMPKKPVTKLAGSISVVTTDTI